MPEEVSMSEHCDINDAVFQAIVDAYDDKNRTLPWTPTYFLALAPLTLDAWERVMKRALPTGYNDFDAEKIAATIRNLLTEKQVDWLLFYAAREGSVAVYIDGGLPELRILANWPSSLSNDHFFTDRVVHYLVKDDTPVPFPETVYTFDRRVLRLWWD